MDAPLDPRLADKPKPDFNNAQYKLHDAEEPHHAQHAHPPILPGDQRAANLSSQHLFQDAYDAPPQQSYAPLPQTPQMREAGNAGAMNITPNAYNVPPSKHTPGSNPTPEDSKRPRACEACRGLKVKCEFEAASPDGPCKRCTKAHRQCLITAPSRKRQKKTDSRVAELEKKIDALTQTLQATRSASQGGENDAHAPGSANRRPSQSHPYEQMASIAYGPQYTGSGQDGNGVPLAPASYGQTMATDMEVQNRSAWPMQDFQQYPRMPELNRAEGGFPKASMEGQNLGSLSKSPMVMAGQKRKHQATHSNAEAGAQAFGSQRAGFGAPTRTEGRPTSKHSMTNEYADVIDKGLISASLASGLFDRYIHQMAPTMPSVIFPSGTTSADVRKTKPILFLAILAVGAMTDHPDLAKAFTKEVMQVYADRIICRGEKSLELIQALLISTLWYWPPEHFEEVKFYQLIHMAAVMGIDIGIHKQNKPSKPSKRVSTEKSVAGMWNWRKQAFPDASSIEARRTWLSCYFVCCNSSTGLRRPNLIAWSPYIAESIEMLETSPLAVPSDKLIAQWARCQHIMERIMPHFGLDEDQSNITLSDKHIQAALKSYEQDLDMWRDQVPVDVRGPLLKMSGHVVSLFMHEIALNVDTNPASQSDHAEEPLESPLPEEQVTALAMCMESIDEIFQTFLSLDIETIRVLPVMHFVRVAYAIAILIKVYFAATSPGNPFASVVDKDNMKVEQYLDDLLQKFKDIVGEDKSRPGSKFLMVLMMLRNCFYRGQKHKNGIEGAGTTQTGQPSRAQSLEGAPPQQSPPQQPQQQPHQTSSGYGQGSTPLDLLSQVATGSSAAPPSNDPKFDSRQPYIPSAQGPWAPWDTPDVPHISTRHQPPSQQNGVAYNIDPSLGGPQAQQMGNFDLNMGVDNGFDSIGMMGEGDLSQYFGDDAYQAFFKAMMEGAGTGGMGFDEYPMSIM